MDVSELTRAAIDIDITDATRAVETAAITAISAQADRLIPLGPEPGTDAWDAEQSTAIPAARQIAWNLVVLRIGLAVGLDAARPVADLRRIGASWALIGAASGVSRQAAHERWGEAVRAHLDPYGTGELRSLGDGDNA